MTLRAGVFCLPAVAVASTYSGHTARTVGPRPAAPPPKKNDLLTNKLHSQNSLKVVFPVRYAQGQGFNTISKLNYLSILKSTLSLDVRQERDNENLFLNF